MKTSWVKLASIASLSLATFAACAASESPTTEQDPQLEDEEQGEAAGEYDSLETELGSTEQGVMSCANPDGANSAMAASAVAVAQDLGRWQAAKDFVIVRTNGS